MVFVEDLFTCRTFDPAQVTDFASAALRIGVILLGAEWFINLCNGDCAGNVGKRNCRCFRAICTRIIGDLRKTFLKYPKIGVPPVIIHFSGIFHEMNHPAIGDLRLMETSISSRQYLHFLPGIQG